MRVGSAFIEAIARAAELGFPAAAVTDRNGLYAAMAFTDAEVQISPSVNAFSDIDGHQVNTPWRQELGAGGAGRARDGMRAEAHALDMANDGFDLLGPGSGLHDDKH